jgi:hypothetical protein
MELTPEAKELIDQMSKKTGMTQVATLSRVVEWFANQSDIVKAYVLGHYPKELQQDLSKHILKEMGGKRSRRR